MKKQRNALRAGLFIVISIGLIFSILVAIGGMAVEPTQARQIRFALKDDLSGLRIGDDVRIGGYKVGEVRNIEVVAATDPRLKQAARPASATAPSTSPAGEDAILVTVLLPSRYELRDGAQVGIQSSFMGMAFINFTSLGGGKVLPDNLVLAGDPNGYTILFDSLAKAAPQITSASAQLNQQIMPDAHRILASVHDQTLPKVNDAVSGYRQTADAGTRLLNKVHDLLDPIFARYTQVTDSASGMMNEVRGIFGETKGDVRGTMKNLNTATGAIASKAPSILDRVDDVLKETRTAIGKANMALDDVQKAVANTRDLTAEARAIVTDNHGNLNAIGRHLRGTALNLELGSAEIRSRPWRLLYSPKKDEISNLVLFDSAREYARGANELNDAAQALRDALQRKDPRPEDLRKLMEQMQKSFERFNDVEKRLLDSVK